MAVIGGVMPAGPMLLISLVRMRTVVLVTSSVCVPGFGLLVGGRPVNVLSVRAADAAVMVVFVGTSSGG